MASLRRKIQLRRAQGEMDVNKIQVVLEHRVERKTIPDELLSNLNCVQILVVVVVLHLYLSERNGLNPMRPRLNQIDILR